MPIIIAQMEIQKYKSQRELHYNVKLKRTQGDPNDGRVVVTILRTGSSQYVSNKVILSDGKGRLSLSSNFGL